MSKKISEKEKLNILRKKYFEKYIQPLIFAFPKKIKLYDSDQIKLRKQIDKQNEDLDNTEICLECNGRGVIFKKNELEYSNEYQWDKPFSSLIVDNRYYTNDTCHICFGNGIIFKNKKKYPVNGSNMRYEDFLKIKCDICGEIYEIFEEEGIGLAFCKHFNIKATPIILKIQVEKQTEKID